MQKHHARKKHSISSRRFQFRAVWFIAVTTLLFVLCGIFLLITLHSEASTKVSPQTHTAISTVVPKQSPVITPVNNSGSSNKSLGPQQPTHIPGNTVSATPTLTASLTPTLIASTPQHTQFGVFPLSSGGPLPVPESVLRPTNIARGMLGSTLVSVYAGSMTKNPQAGILCVLRENLTTGEIHLQVYQGPQTEGALTILAVQKNILKIANAKTQGSFDLNTNTFHW